MITLCIVMLIAFGLIDIVSFILSFIWAAFKFIWKIFGGAFLIVLLILLFLLLL